MPRSRPAPLSDVRSFEDLLRGVLRTLLEGKRQIERATVFANWDTGRLINTHVLLNQGRANYAGHVMSRLAKRSGINERVLYHCAQFHRRFAILNRRSKLGWSHYRLLCQVDDNARRAALEADAQKRDWTAEELEERVRQFNLVSAESEPGRNGTGTSHRKLQPLVARHGTPGLYPVVARRDGLAVDLGFKFYLPLAPAEARRRRLAAGAIVRLAPDDTFSRDDEATKADLFTYRTTDVRVVDGDTLAVTIALPPGREIDKKLRLRGLNCPEMDTARGRAAKSFSQTLIGAASGVLLTTTKPDKYDRYLADVFIEQESGEPAFLNNALLENGHAVRSDGSAPMDWIA